MAESMKVVPVPQDELSPPPYMEQQAGGASSGSQPQPGYPAQPGYTAQPGYPAQLGFPAQPGYPAQHGYPAKGGYPEQQPYTVQPGYPGPHPFAAQHAYPPETGQPVSVQQASTVIMQPATQAVILSSAPPRPSTWLGLSIFTFLFCVWPIGLAAIVFSCLVDSSYDGGDYEGARRNSNIAKWLNVSAILSGIGVIAFIIIRFAVIVSSAVN